MTHITEPRVISNHAAVGVSTDAVPHKTLTVKNILLAPAVAAPPNAGK
jgi:hypothetical protein